MILVYVYNHINKLYFLYQRLKLFHLFDKKTEVKSDKRITLSISSEYFLVFSMVKSHINRLSSDKNAIKFLLYI